MMFGTGPFACLRRASAVAGVFVRLSDILVNVVLMGVWHMAASIGTPVLAREAARHSVIDST